MKSKNVVDVTDETFDAEVVAAPLTVLVDFTAQWCGPCRALAPIVDEIADENVGRIKVVKVDLDASPNAARRYGIRGAPTVAIFRGGERIAQHVGLTTKKKLLALVAQ